MYYGSVLKVSDTDYVPVLIQESALPGFACPCGKPLTVPAAAALPPLAPVSRPAPPVPLHLPLQERSEFERAYPGLVTETLELVQTYLPKVCNICNLDAWGFFPWMGIFAKGAVKNLHVLAACLNF